MHFPGDNNDSPVDIDSRLEDVCLNLMKYLSEGLKKKKKPPLIFIFACMMSVEIMMIIKIRYFLSPENLAKILHLSSK